jgi:AcrR family transcriptional regulator
MEIDKNTILSKVYVLYLKFGIKSITLDDIAREIGISKKTIYSYFADKHDLVQQVFNYEKETRTDCATGVYPPGLNAIEQMWAINMHISSLLKEYNPGMNFDLKKHYPEIYEKRRTSFYENTYRHQIENLNKGISEGLYRLEINVEYIARLFVLRVSNIHDFPLLDASEFFKPEFIQEVFIYHIRGIASKKGLEVLEKILKNKEL